MTFDPKVPVARAVVVFLNHVIDLRVVYYTMRVYIYACTCIYCVQARAHKRALLFVPSSRCTIEVQGQRIDFFFVGHCCLIVSVL